MLRLLYLYRRILQVENRKQHQEAQALQQQEKKATLPIITSGPKSTVETAKLKARLMALQIERE
jgi:hypothetical protein